MHLEEFITHYCLNAPQIMWFLGAGASRSAGMPSATDIIWDLKRRYYCLNENREITDNELSNEAIKNKIQNYLEAASCPPMWSEEEYAYYFKLVFGDKPEAHQKYLEEKLSPEKISINSGHRILASLMAMDKTRLVFTTNFDAVLENAFALMTGKNLHSFSLDGSYAVTNALNNESFPIYAKMHGDFRYFEMKNLPEQLIKNDAEIEKSFLAASSRYGLIVTGYSGRDKNVMDAFTKAIEQVNAFPKGLFWITPIGASTYPAVQLLLEKAKDKGINAHLVEVETFDALLGKVWKQIEPKNVTYDKKIRRLLYEIPKIQRYTGASYPLIRTNAFPILSMPKSCLSITTKTPLSFEDFKQKEATAKTSAILQREKTILAWGTDEEINKVIPKSEIASWEKIDLSEKLSEFGKNSLFNAFISRALARALVKDKPLRLRKKHNRFFAVLSAKHEKYSEVEGILKEALAVYDFGSKKHLPPKELVGRFPRAENTFWMEAAELSLDYYDGKFWLLITPDIWIEPDSNRKAAKDFLIEKRRKRYNSTQNKMLDAWKKILFGSDVDFVIKTFDDIVENNAEFKISITTAYSQRTSK